MLVKPNQNNPYDPSIKMNAIHAPISFTVRNIDRKIEILMGVWASAEALNGGFLPISQSYFFIDGDSYFDMVEAQSENFIAIGDAIDKYVKSATSFYDDAITIPTYIPTRPVTPNPEVI